MFDFNPDYPNATDEQKWEQIRLWRNVQLAKSDWTQLPDAPVDKEAWASYRQALRDLPESTNNPKDVELPNKP